MASMLMGVASFSCMDAALKLLRPRTIRLLQVAALRGLAALPVVFIWAMYAGGPRQLVQRALAVAPDPRRALGIHDGHVRLRIQKLSLAKTYALFFVAPLLIAIFSTFMLGERVHRAQWVAIAIGFAGVLFVRSGPNIASAGSAPLAVLGYCAVLRVFVGAREDHRAHR